MRNNNPDERPESSSMSVEDAGRRGGEATLREHGPEFYSKIGQKGGRSRAQRRNDLSESDEGLSDVTR